MHIEGILPKNSRDSFVDMQSQKDIKDTHVYNNCYEFVQEQLKTDREYSYWCLRCYIFKNLYDSLLLQLAALN